MINRRAERCDARCPAAALVHVQRHGHDLAFCGHCFDTLVVILFDQGWSVRDDTRPALRKAEAERR